MSTAADLEDSTRPLAGVRVIDYSQFVAGPLCTMLLAHLGADVVKVESPVGDAYRHYEPFADGASSRFYALNQGRRSVVCDLKTDAGRGLSDALLRDADVVVHNMPPARAIAFGLDPKSVHAVNERATVATVSAFGTDGPSSGQVGYDLIAQAHSGLLMADADPSDTFPRRSGNVPFSDITAGLLTCISVLAGLSRRRQDGSAPGSQFEVSLLGAALLTQIQDLVRYEHFDEPSSEARVRAVPADLRVVGERVREGLRLDPYYRCYEASDGFFALACLTTAQRRRVLDVLELADAWVNNPQERPRDEAERRLREDLTDVFEQRLLGKTAGHWIGRLRELSVPCGDVRMLPQAFDDPQILANGLVRSIPQGPNGRIDVLGTPFKINGVPSHALRPAPRLGEHTADVLAATHTTRKPGNDASRA